MELVIGIVILATRGCIHGCNSDSDIRIQGQRGELWCRRCCAECTSYIVEMVAHGSCRWAGNFLGFIIICRRVARESAVDVSLDRVAHSAETTAVERMPAVFALGEIQWVSHFAGFVVRGNQTRTDAATGL